MKYQTEKTVILGEEFTRDEKRQKMGNTVFGTHKRSANNKSEQNPLIRGFYHGQEMALQTIKTKHSPK